MLEMATKKKIVKVTNTYWEKHVCESTFATLVAGKEPGHRMADYVDDKTVSLLKIEFDTRYEADIHDRIRRRSMGDVWIHSNGIYNPVNVKAGEQGKKGQPNLVSMQKVLDYILKRWIDSYYLLIVKFHLGKLIEHRAYLIDLLDWLDFVAYDAGPGQIMLRENDFYEAHESGIVPENWTFRQKSKNYLLDLKKAFKVCLAIGKNGFPGNAAFLRHLTQQTILRSIRARCGLFHDYCKATTDVQAATRSIHHAGKYR